MCYHQPAAACVDALLSSQASPSPIIKRQIAAMLRIAGSPAMRSIAAIRANTCFYHLGESDYLIQANSISHDRAEHQQMPCYLFTYHAYGSWMPDHKRGYVHRGQGV